MTEFPVDRDKIYIRPPLEKGDVFDFEQITKADFPPRVVGSIVDFMKKGRVDGNFENPGSDERWTNFLKVREPQITTFIATAVSHPTDPNESDEWTYLVDQVRGRIAGIGVLNKPSLSDIKTHYKTDHPFPQWTENTDTTTYKHRGLGERRIALMATLSSRLYGKSLYSSAEITPEARAVWEELGRAGRTRRIDLSDEDDYRRFEFIK